MPEESSSGGTSLEEDPPPSYEEAAGSLRRAKRGGRRPSAASNWTGATSIALSTNERQPLLAPDNVNDLERDTRFTLARYFFPVTQKKYWKALLHLVVLNFPFALLVWIVLFVGVSVGSTLLLTLPLGALFWWITLIASRFFTNVELSMQARFHGVFSPEESRHRPVFHRPPTEYDPETNLPIQATFLQNSYAMFQDWEGSYIPIFYFLVVKAAITLFLTPLLLAVVLPAIVLVVPLPAVLRLGKRVGRWQARIAVEGLA